MKSTATANSVLTEIAGKLLQNPENFAGLKLFPLFHTELLSSDYYVLDAENLSNIPRTVRHAPGSGFSRSVTKLSGDQYRCEDFGHEELVGDDEARRYARKGAAEEAAARRVQTVVLANHDIRAKELATGASVPSADVVVKWNDPASRPTIDVIAARKAVFEACGLEANVMVVGREVFEQLKENPAVKAVIKISSEDSRWPLLLARLFDVDEFVVARGVVNDAQEGAAAIDVSEVWVDSVILAHVDFTEDLRQPSFGRTFIASTESNPTGVTVLVYREESKSSNVIRAKQLTAEKLTGALCGFHLQDVLG